MGSEDCFDLRRKVITLLRNELPVLRAKARVSQEDIANHDKHIAPSKLEKEKCRGQHFSH